MQDKSNPSKKKSIDQNFLANCSPKSFFKQLQNNNISNKNDLNKSQENSNIAKKITTTQINENCQDGQTQYFVKVFSPPHSEQNSQSKKINQMNELAPQEKKNRFSNENSNQTFITYVQALNTMDTINQEKKNLIQNNLLDSKRQEQLKELETNLYNKFISIEPVLTIKAKNQIGEQLLKNGRFIISLIAFITKDYTNNYIGKHLYQQFNEKNQIQYEINYFKEARKNIFEVKQVINEKQDNFNQFMGRQLKRNLDKFECSQYSENNTHDDEQNQRNKQSKKRISMKNTKPTKRLTSHTVSKDSKQSNTKSNRNEAQSLKKQMRSFILHKNQNSQEKDSKFGSCYRYKLVASRGSNKKHLEQVRTSARLSKKNKDTKSQCSRQESIIKQNKSSKKSNIKQKKQSKKKSTAKKSTTKALSQKQENSNDDYEIQIDWIKKHCKEIEQDDIQLYTDYQALTKNDYQITQFLLSLENQKLEEERQQSPEQHSQDFRLQDNNEIDYSNQGIIESVTLKGVKEPPKQIFYSQKKQQSQREFENSHAQSQYHSDLQPISMELQFEKKRQSLLAKKKKFKIEEKTFPVMVDQVIDPNINEHGIYALVRLSGLTQIEMGARYALTPLALYKKYSNRAIKQDLEKAKQLVGPFHSNNIGFLPISSKILRMIENHCKQK